VSMLRVAVLLTCHNRAMRTVACLDTLTRQTGMDRVALDVVVVDAGSTDGTRAAVMQQFPEVTILDRGPELFWNGGMREAMSHAYQWDPDLYLWLNDDVELDRDAVTRLLTCHRELVDAGAPPCLVVGSTRDPDSAAPTYGGVVRTSRWRPLRYELVLPGQTRLRVETMNGNCVLVPREVVSRIGNLAAVYTHGMGDFDYGHRAVRAGCEVWIVPGTVGTCSRNAPVKRASTLREYRQRSTSPTGGLPLSEWSVFARRAGPLWPVYAVSPYIRRFVRWFARR
jgi:GT2 family glycosyltransferase